MVGRVKPPVFYSFRRCPYAMRARLALQYAGVAVEHREILLKDKPKAMLLASPKGTVPVLVLQNGDVIDESLDIMLWALTQHDPEVWGTNIQDPLITHNDTIFKQSLDRYKYPNRYPNEDCTGALEVCLEFLNILESTKERKILTDMAIFPSVRQFSKVEPEMFKGLSIPYTHKWLEQCIISDLFLKVMEKHDIWEDMN